MARQNLLLTAYLAHHRALTESTAPPPEQAAIHHDLARDLDVSPRFAGGVTDLRAWSTW